MAEYELLGKENLLEAEHAESIFHIEDIKIF